MRGGAERWPLAAGPGSLRDTGLRDTQQRRVADGLPSSPNEGQHFGNVTCDEADSFNEGAAVQNVRNRDRRMRGRKAETTVINRACQRRKRVQEM